MCAGEEGLGSRRGRTVLENFARQIIYLSTLPCTVIKTREYGFLQDINRVKSQVWQRCTSSIIRPVLGIHEDNPLQLSSN